MRGSLLVVLLAGCYAPASLPSLAPVARHVPHAVETATGTELALDEAAAIAYALQHGPQLAERSDVEAEADAEIDASRQLSNPELRISQSSEEGAAGSSSKLGVGLRIHVDAPWTLAARVDRARADREAERARSAVTVREVTAEIRDLYAQLAFGELMHTMLDKQLVVLRERNRVLTERLEHATATRLEYLLAEHDLADLESTKADVDLDMLRAGTRIARLIGIPSDRAWHPIASVAQLCAVQTNLDADRLAGRALASPPALAEVAARANAAGASAYEQKTRRWPSLEWLQVERATSPETEWSIGVSVTLPLLSLNSGKIKVATAEQRRYLRARDRIANDTLLRVRETIALVEATGKHAHELAARLEPLDKEITALVEREKDSAVADPLKLLLLEERHVRAQRDLLDASYAHRRAQIQLEALVGDAP